MQNAPFTCHQHPSPSMGPLPEGSGNKKMRSSIRKTTSLPSMGPLPEGSGNHQLDPGCLLASRHLQWGRFPKEAEINLNATKVIGLTFLQWGRFPKEAEMISALRWTARPSTPSMGPLPEGSGNPARTSPANPESHLQWGRFPKEAEIGAVSSVGMVRRRPSMGPLPEGSGNWESDGNDPYGQPSPSMGPLPEGSGNIESLHGVAGLPHLQWGRFPKEAEIRKAAGARRRRVRLQWGRFRRKRKCY